MGRGRRGLLWTVGVRILALGLGLGFVRVDGCCFVCREGLGLGLGGLVVL